MVSNRGIGIKIDFLYILENPHRHYTIWQRQSNILNSDKCKSGCSLTLADCACEPIEKTVLQEPLTFLSWMLMLTFPSCLDLEFHQFFHLPPQQQSPIHHLESTNHFTLDNFIKSASLMYQLIYILYLLPPCWKQINNGIKGQLCTMYAKG